MRYISDEVAKLLLGVFHLSCHLVEAPGQPFDLSRPGFRNLLVILTSGDSLGSGGNSIDRSVNRAGEYDSNYQGNKKGNKPGQKNGTEQTGQDVPSPGPGSGQNYSLKRCGLLRTGWSDQGIGSEDIGLPC